MKPINEIRIRLSALICLILIPLFKDFYPSGSGYIGFENMLCICIIGFYLGCCITNLLIVLKQWWNES